MKKRCVSFILVLTMVFTFAGFPGIGTFATAKAEGVFTEVSSIVTRITEGTTQHEKTLEPWDGSTSTKPSVGDGSETSPFEISNGAELAWFSKYVNGTTSSTVYKRECHVKLVEDIDLNNKDWHDFRIGKSWNFAGVFDGQGHTIYNLYMYQDTAAPGGLFARFGLTGNEACIKNLNIVDAKIIATVKASHNNETGYAFLCGRTVGKDSVIDNVSVSGSITVPAGESISVPIAGGLVAHAANGTISNCYSNVEIDLTNATNGNTDYSNTAVLNRGIGGIAGVCTSSKTGSDTDSTVTLVIKNCISEGTINAPNNSRVGGIVGAVQKQYNTVIEDCYNTGDITGYRQVGGVIGWCYDGATSNLVPKRIYNTGNVTAKTATSTYASGLVNGLSGAKLTYPAYSSGNVSVSAEGAEEFNGYCGMLYTNAASSPAWTNACGIYNSSYSQKAPLGAKGVATSSASGISMMSHSDFIGGAAAEVLNAGSDTVGWYNVKGINNGYPVTEDHAQTPLTDGHSYYVEEGSLSFTADEPGCITFDITPIGDMATITVSDDTLQISEEGTYLFDALEATFDMNVSGRAIIKKVLPGQIKEKEIEELENGYIKVKFPSNESATVALGLYKDSRLVDISYETDVAPEIVDSQSYVSTKIKVKDTNLADYTLRAFLWAKDKLLKPLSSAPYIGKFDGIEATAEEKQAAIYQVAESYYLKGNSVQYDDSVMAEGGITRAEYGVKSPEDYSSENIGYTNDAYFCYDVFSEAFDIELPVTFDGFAENNSMKVFTEKAADVDAVTLKAQIKSGDIIALDSDDDRKLLIYAGDNTVYYAEGNSYDYTTGAENEEINGAIKKAALDNMFVDGYSVSVSGYEDLILLRPFAAVKGFSLPFKTKSRIDNMSGIVAEKTASVKKGISLQPGEELTYTYTIENKGSTEKELIINDIVPVGTTYVSGCENEDNGEINWTVTVAPGETVNRSYTVKIDDDSSLCKTYIKSENGTVGGIGVDCYPVYVARTLNETDQSRIDTAIQALMHSEFEGVEMLKQIYLVAFTRSFSLDGTAFEILSQLFVDKMPEMEGDPAQGETPAIESSNLLTMTVPKMFGGTKVTSEADEMYGVERTRKIERSNLLAGDVIIANEDIDDKSTAKMYIYNGEQLIEPVSLGMECYDTDGILDKLIAYDRFIVIRPSVAISDLNNFPPEQELNLTPAQKALVETAKSYMLRGDRIQYDDCTMFTLTDYRWTKATKHPEDYTTSERGYTNCAAFTYDVYYHALGYNIGRWTTSDLNKATSMSAYAYTNTYNPSESDESEKPSEEHQQEVAAAIRAAIQPGDIIVIRRFSGSGHAMLYVGNDTIIHSNGANYDRSLSEETYEATIRYKSLEDLFTETDKCHLFSRVQYIKLIRPLKSWSGEVPENTVNRINNMKGISAEKLSSHSTAVTINPGEEITYTLSVYNTNKESVTLDITDVVPDNATYLSGAENVSGKNLSWKVTVQPGEKMEITYKIKVNVDAEDGTYIDNSKGLIGGVMLRCPDTLIKNTLTKSEQQRIISAIRNLEGTSVSGVEFANQVYKNALGVDNILYDYDGDGSYTYDDVTGGTFKSNSSGTGFLINRDEDYGCMVAGNIYGGRKYAATRYSGECTPLSRIHNLVPGDIFVGRTLSATVIHIFDGEHFIDLTSKEKIDVDYRLMKAMGFGNCFAVIRPSQVME